MAKFIHVVLRSPSPLDKFLLNAKAVRGAVDGNSRFPDASALVAELDARIQALDAAMSGTATERRAAREAVRETLAHLRDHVQRVAETASGTVDLSAIRALVQSAGMDLYRVVPRPKAVFAAKPGLSAGTVDLTAPRSLKRDPHDWQISTDQETWTALPGTRRAKTQVTGLPVGVPHYFRHRLLTTDGYTEWSDPILIIVK